MRSVSPSDFISQIETRDYGYSIRGFSDLFLFLKKKNLTIIKNPLLLYC